MSSFESAVPSILQGVSQQLPKLRLPGQVTAQENMLSDVVTNLRRRPGSMFRYTVDLGAPCTVDNVEGWDTDIAGARVHVLVNCTSGRLLVMDQTFNILANLQSDYLKAGTNRDIRVTTIGDEFFLLNTAVKPAAVAAAVAELPPTRRGFLYVKAGAFSKTYSATFTTNLGTATATFTAPSGTAAGDAAKTTPEAIATELAKAVLTVPGVSATKVVGAYIYYECLPTVTSLVIASGSGSGYIQPSNSSKVRLEGDLPAQLPPEANGYTVAVGEQRLYKYYTYRAATAEWLESGVYGSPAGLSGMPISLTQAAGVWSLKTGDYEGRLAGDDDTNPLPEFLARGISGMAAYQSRLVLLGGSKVYMSGSTNPRRFMRSTVAGLLDADPIAVGSSANSSAEYQYAVQFQKDLLLFSSKYQALIPSGGQAIVPRTATVLLTSSHNVDMSSEPVPIGRTLLFAAPRSADFFGFMEMIPSQYTDSQYVSTDATAHLPKYMGGKCRFAVSSSVANMVLFGPSGDPRSLIVYEYAWSGDEKVQQAWHTWRFKYPIAGAYFSNESINVLFVHNGVLVGASIDPKQGVVSSDASRRPYLDLYSEVEVAGNIGTVPAWLRAFDPSVWNKLMLSVSTGKLAGERVGTTNVDALTGAFTTVPSFPSGRVALGIPYRSMLSPSPPVLLDREGRKVESAKLTILRYGVSTQNSMEYRVLVSDGQSVEPEAVDQATLRYCSSELVLGRARYGVASRAVVPARLDADTAALVLYTEDAGELNVTGIDYVARSNQKIRRR